MIRYQQFSKRFGAYCAVESLSLRIRPGEAVALLGPNGSGKTTSLKAAAGLNRPSDGRVLLGELPATSPQARRQISFLPQKVAFPEALTGREVLEFYRKLRGVAPAQAEAALERASLNGAAVKPTGTYSGGMLQRLGLAVAALPDAPVLLLDEPTASLDAQGISAFHELVEQRRRQGRTLLFASHQLGDVERLADRVAILVAGKLVALLTQSELSAKLAERGELRVRLSQRGPELLERVCAVAPDARLSGDQFLISGPPAARLAALDVLRNGGAGIQGISAEEGRLDLLYHELAAAPQLPPEVRESQ